MLLIHLSHLINQHIFPLLLPTLVYRAHRSVFSSVVSFPFRVKLNIKSLLPSPNPVSQRNLPFYRWFGQWAYGEARSGYHGDHSMRHRWRRTFCYSINAFVSSDTFLKTSDDACLSSIKQPLGIQCLETLADKTCWCVWQAIRERKWNNLKLSWTHNSGSSGGPVSQNENTTKSSCEVAMLIAKHGEPFTFYS